MNFLLSFELGKIRDKVEALSYCQNNDYQRFSGEVTLDPLEHKYKSLQMN